MIQGYSNYIKLMNGLMYLIRKDFEVECDT